jgi:hypothetical protein
MEYHEIIDGLRDFQLTDLMRLFRGGNAHSMILKLIKKYTFSRKH